MYRCNLALSCFNVRIYWCFQNVFKSEVVESLIIKRLKYVSYIQKYQPH